MPGLGPQGLLQPFSLDMHWLIRKACLAAAAALLVWALVTFRNLELETFK